MTTRSLAWTYASSYYRAGRDDGVRVRFDVTSGCNISPKVFAYLMQPVNPLTGSTAGTFSHVCSPVDLEEYPEDEPIEDAEPPWYRLDYVDVLVRSVEEAAQFIADVQVDLNRLKDTLDVTDTLFPGVDGVIGTDVCTEPSSSATSSDSDPGSASAGPVLSLTATGSLATTVGRGTAWQVTGTGAGSNMSDGNYSEVTLRRGQASQSLIIQGFDFSTLPTDAEIVGFEVSAWLRETAGGSLSAAESIGECELTPALDSVNGPPLVKMFSLHQPTLGLLDNKAESDPLIADAFAAIEAGASDDLWGNTHWTAPLVKSGEFGVLLVIGTALSTPLAAAAVDGATITVYYREAT